ncbi:hypothetical protein MC862_003832 [Proteus mirabilis]|nr:hypothetical protein [Proteus mirabilis]
MNNEWMDSWTSGYFEEALLRCMLLIDHDGKVTKDKTFRNMCEVKLGQSTQSDYTDFRNSNIFLPSSVDGEFLLNGISRKHPLPENITAFPYPTTFNHFDDSYLSASITLTRLRKLPSDVIREAHGVFYKMTIFNLIGGVLVGENNYISVDANDVIHRCHLTSKKDNRVLKQKDLRSDLSLINSVDDDMFNSDYPVTMSTFLSSLVFQEYDETMDGWVVDTIYKNQVISIGLNIEQIKSIFYSLQTPLTETGRHSPFIHWVRCHQRRLKSGIDVDVKKHLRGSESFFYGGMLFRLRNTGKGM